MKGTKGPTRRTVLKGLAGGIALAACSSPGADMLGADASDGTPPLDAQAAIAPPDALPEVDAFPLGISSGDFTGDRAVLWANYSGSAPLAALAYRMDGAMHVQQLGPFAAAPADGGFVHVAITGLVAGARYRYVFVELDGAGIPVARSRIGRFRAPIADTATETLTFGAVACTEATRPTAVLARAAERVDLDAFIFAGDNAYCDGAETLPEYRAKYVTHFGRADHIALRAQTGMYITWDDHEIKNDLNPETIADAQLAAAFDAFFEHAPLTRVAGSENRIWRSSRWGHTVEVFVLDTRSERKPSSLITGNHEYISDAQMAWLKAGLQASPAVFKLIVNSVPITNMPSVWDAYPTDRWEAYSKQRTEILSFIDDNAIRGVLWLSGDFHLAFISKVSTSGPGANQREVLCGPGGQSANSLLPSLFAPQFSFKTGTNNFTTLKLDPATRAVTVGYVNAAGETFHTESFVP
jgi:alkaline phosphatase D